MRYRELTLYLFFHFVTTLSKLPNINVISLDECKYIALLVDLLLAKLHANTPTICTNLSRKIQGIVHVSQCSIF